MATGASPAAGLVEGAGSGAALDAALAALAVDGVAGASEARRLQLGLSDAAHALSSVNPPGKSPALDALVRRAAQPGLRRRGAVRLALKVYSGDPAAVPALARLEYLATVRGAVADDLVSNGAHAYAAASAATAAAICAALAYCKLAGGRPRLEAALQQALKVALLALLGSACVSAAALARAALRSQAARSARFRSAYAGSVAWMKAALAAAVALAAVAAAAVFGMPVAYFAGSALAASLLIAA